MSESTSACALSALELSALMTDPMGDRVPLPDGVRDVLPVEAAELSALERTLTGGRTGASGARTGCLMIRGACLCSDQI